MLRIEKKLKMLVLITNILSFFNKYQEKSAEIREKMVNSTDFQAVLPKQWLLLGIKGIIGNIKLSYQNLKFQWGLFDKMKIIQKSYIGQ